MYQLNFRYKGENVMKMTQNFIKTVCIISIMSIAISCGKKDAPQDASNDFFFKVQFVIGDVKILKADGEITPKPGDQINVNDFIVTGSKSSIDIIYGTSGIVRINGDSKISIAALADAKNNNTMLNMEKGGVFATFTKLNGTGFNVKTPTVVASVRGTSFEVINDKAGAKVSVLKGTVSAAPVKDGNIIEGKSVDVQANQKTDYINDTTVDKMISADSQAIAVTAMSPAETLKLQEESNNIIKNVDAIEGLSTQEKEEMKNAMTVADVPAETKKNTNVNSKQKEKAAPAPDPAAEKKRIEEEKKKQEEVKKQKEEQIKKERISNIPTM